MGYRRKYGIPVIPSPILVSPPSWDYTYSVILRALALRKQTPCRLGVIITEAGQHYICGAPGDPLGIIDPHGNKNYYRVEELDRLCSELEADPTLMWLDANNGPYPPRKSPQSETNTRNNKKMA